MADEVVKVDADLMRKIEKLISENKYKYSSKKQVVNLAIIEFLSSFSWKEKQNPKYKNKQVYLNSSNKRGKKEGKS